MSKLKEGFGGAGVGQSKDVRGVLELHIIPKYIQGGGQKACKLFGYHLWMTPNARQQDEILALLMHLQKPFSGKGL